MNLKNTPSLSVFWVTALSRRGVQTRPLYGSLVSWSIFDGVFLRFSPIRDPRNPQDSSTTTSQETSTTTSHTLRFSLHSPRSHLPSSLLLLLLLLGRTSEIQEFSLSNLKSTSFLRVSWVSDWVESQKYSIRTADTVKHAKASRIHPLLVYAPT